MFVLFCEWNQTTLLLISITQTFYVLLCQHNIIMVFVITTCLNVYFLGVYCFLKKLSYFFFHRFFCGEASVEKWLLRVLINQSSMVFVVVLISSTHHRQRKLLGPQKRGIQFLMMTMMSLCHKGYSGCRIREHGVLTVMLVLRRGIILL